MTIFSVESTTPQNKEVIKILRVYMFILLEHSVLIWKDWYMRKAPVSTIFDLTEVQRSQIRGYRAAFNRFESP